jgi:hypothetical protein
MGWQTKQPIYLPQISQITADLSIISYASIGKNRINPYSLPSHLWDGNKVPLSTFHKILQHPQTSAPLCEICGKNCLHTYLLPSHLWDGKQNIPYISRRYRSLPQIFNINDTGIGKNRINPYSLPSHLWDGKQSIPEYLPQISQLTADL